MRLYRALTNFDFDSKLGAYVLNSNSRAFEKNNILSDKINLPNEIYSHIMNTHKQLCALKNRIIYSFTDDYDIAKSILNKHSDYEALGYIDIDFTKIESNGIYFIFPAYDISSWIKLATMFNTEEIQNVVNDYKTRFAYTLIPSQKSMLSWAKNKKEYVVICKNLELKLCEDEGKEVIENKQWTYNWGKNFNDKNDIKKFAEKMEEDLYKLSINPRRKAYVLSALKVIKEATL